MTAQDDSRAPVWVVLRMIEALDDTDDTGAWGGRNSLLDILSKDTREMSGWRSSQYSN